MNSEIARLRLDYRAIFEAYKNAQLRDDDKTMRECARLLVKIADLMEANR